MASAMLTTWTPVDDVLTLTSPVADSVTVKVKVLLSISLLVTVMTSVVAKSSLSVKVSGEALKTGWVINRIHCHQNLGRNTDCTITHRNG